MTATLFVPSSARRYAMVKPAVPGLTSKKGNYPEISEANVTSSYNNIIIRRVSRNAIVVSGNVAEARLCPG
jgi:hypothetical protein